MVSSSSRQVLGSGTCTWAGSTARSSVYDPTHFVDISDHLERGIASLAAHTRYLAHVGTDARAFLTGIATQAGGRCGVRYATEFELIPF